MVIHRLLPFFAVVCPAVGVWPAPGWCAPQPDTHVDPLCASPDSFPRDNNVANVDECKAKCVADPACKSIQYRGDGCQYCSADGSRTRYQAGVTLFTQFCPKLMWNWCLPQFNTHVMPSCSSPTSLPREEGVSHVSHCQVKCEADPFCKAVQYRGGGCQYCTHDGTETRHEPGVTLYARCQGASTHAAATLGWCPGRPNTHAAPSCASPASLPREESVEDVLVCQRKCDADPECRSLQVRAGGCQYCSHDGSAVTAREGVTLYTRLCAPRVKRSSSWCPPQQDTHVTPSCSSPDDLPREEGVEDVLLCQAKCDEHADCRSVQYRGGGCQYCSHDGATTREHAGVILYTQLCNSASQEL